MLSQPALRSTLSTRLRKTGARLVVAAALAGALATAGALSAPYTARADALDDNARLCAANPTTDIHLCPGVSRLWVLRQQIFQVQAQRQQLAQRLQQPLTAAQRQQLVAAEQALARQQAALIQEFIRLYQELYVLWVRKTQAQVRPGDLNGLPPYIRDAVAPLFDCRGAVHGCFLPGGTPGRSSAPVSVLGQLAALGIR